MDGRTAALIWRDLVHGMAMNLVGAELPIPQVVATEQLALLTERAKLFVQRLSCANPATCRQLLGTNLDTLLPNTRDEMSPVVRRQLLPSCSISRLSECVSLTTPLGALPSIQPTVYAV